jgi:hypothetical protein
LVGLSNHVRAKHRASRDYMDTILNYLSLHATNKAHIVSVQHNEVNCVLSLFFPENQICN